MSRGIKYINGDLFDAPVGSILAHSCNCHGSWGSGVAKIFRKKFPDAYQQYHEKCAEYKSKESKRSSLLGTCLLIPSVDIKGQSYTVACLFTSVGMGATKDSPAQIVQSTDLAVADLQRQLTSGAFGTSVHMPRINAGLFAVPWLDTETVLAKYSDSLEVVVHDL